MIFTKIDKVFEKIFGDNTQTPARLKYIEKILDLSDVCTIESLISTFISYLKQSKLGRWTIRMMCKTFFRLCSVTVMSLHKELRWHFIPPLGRVKPGED